MKTLKKKVIIAMSGGVDSSVAAWLLQNKGFEVKGIFLKLSNSDFSKESFKKAKKISKILKIPISAVDARKEFEKKVIDYFLKESKRGRTPNPCVVCNEEIKFGVLLKKALETGADFLATGHYVKKTESGIGLKTIYKLSRAKDKKRDQSYFLWRLNQRKLKRILFPLGEYMKKEVTETAKTLGIMKLIKGESRDICFIENTTGEFLASHLSEKPGKIVNAEGKTMGKHRGLWFYTIGQRKGIKLSGGPYYVLNKDFKNNTLIVTKNGKNLSGKELFCSNLNWISGREPKFPLKAKAKIRYRHRLSPATSSFSKKGLRVMFEKPQRAITAGQSIAFYKNEELLGGGVII